MAEAEGELTFRAGVEKASELRRLVSLAQRSSPRSPARPPLGYVDNKNANQVPRGTVSREEPTIL